MTLSTRLTHDKTAGHLDGGVGQAAVPLLPEDVLRFRSRAHFLAVQLNLTFKILKMEFRRCLRCFSRFLFQNKRQLISRANTAARWSTTQRRRFLPVWNWEVATPVLVLAGNYTVLIKIDTNIREYREYKK